MFRASPFYVVGPPGLEPGTNGFTIRYADIRVFPLGVDYLTALNQGAGRSNACN